MKFEEALAHMREGKKITHDLIQDNDGENNVYFMSCRVGFKFCDIPVESWPISVVKMKGEYKHADMGAGSIDNMFHPGTLMVKEEFLEKPCKHGVMPQLNLLLIMCNDWEFYGDDKDGYVND